MERTDAQETGNPCDDPYRPPASVASHPDGDPRGESDLPKLLRGDERRALAWIVVMTVTLLFSSVIRIGAEGPTAWSTWMTNWKSNVSFYFSLLSLVFAARFGLRSASTLRKLKVVEDQRSDGRD